MSKSKSKSEAKRVAIQTSAANILVGYTVVIPEEFSMGKDPATKKKSISMGLGSSIFHYAVGEPVFMPLAHFNHLVGCGVPFMSKCEVTPVFEQRVFEEVVKPEDVSEVLPEQAEPLVDELKAAETEADEAAVDTTETSMQTE